MNAIPLFLTSFGAAYLANRLSRHKSFSLAELAIGLVGGLVALSVAQFFGAEGGPWGPGLPLLIAWCLPIGLESLQRRSILR